MRISVELSLYPLQENYESLISGYIQSIHDQPGVDARVNAMSTQIFGEYDDVMQALQHCTRKIFELDSRVCLVCKFLNTDRSEATF